jgi:hypothetical protein
VNWRVGEFQSPSHQLTNLPIAREQLWDVR